MNYEIERLTDLERELSLEDNRFRDEFQSEFINEISDLDDLISDIKYKYKTFKANYKLEEGLD